MKQVRKGFLVALVAAVFATTAVKVWAGYRDSDVDATAPDFTKKTLIVHIQGQLTTDVTAKAKWTNVEGWKITNVKATCRDRDGAASDAAFDVTAGGTTILTADIAVDTDGVTASGTLGSTTTFAAGTAFAIDWDRSNSGTADDCDIVIYYRSKVATESF